MEEYLDGITNKNVIKDTYLGDGVYASYDGHHIILDLRQQLDQTMFHIALEPEVLLALDRYRKEIKESKDGNVLP